MAEVKDKLVTVESLSILHEHTTKNYMSSNNPTGSGAMAIDGSGDISGNLNVGSFTIGSKIKLIPTSNSLEIVFLDEEG
jgi:hypothetical protein